MEKATEFKKGAVILHQEAWRGLPHSSNTQKDVTISVQPEGIGEARHYRPDYRQLSEAGACMQDWHPDKF